MSTLVGMRISGDDHEMSVPGGRGRSMSGIWDQGGGEGGVGPCLVSGIKEVEGR